MRDRWEIEHVHVHNDQHCQYAQNAEIALQHNAQLQGQAGSDVRVDEMNIHIICSVLSYQ